MLHHARAIVGRDVGVIRMLRLEGPGKVLGGEEAEMVFDRENLRLHVQMILRSGGVATSAEAQATILDHLKTADGGR